MFDTDTTESALKTRIEAQSPEFRRFKTTVRDRALAAKSEMGWDTADMNKNLLMLGVEPHEEWVLETEIVAKQTYRMTIGRDATYRTKEAAEAAVTAMSHTQIIGNLPYTAWELVERAEPKFVVAGAGSAEPDPIAFGDDLDAYKKLVRRTAIRVQKERNWCEEGIGRYLRAMGLPPKQAFTVPIVVTTTQQVGFVVEDAESIEEARQIAAERQDGVQETVRANIGRRATLVSHEVAAPGTPRHYDRGDTDDTLASQGIDSSGWCGNGGPAGYQCSLHPGHEGEQHVAGSGTAIVRVWGIAEGTPRRR